MSEPHTRLDYLASVDRPRLSLPDGKRLAVFLVVNIERWDIARPMPRQVLTPPQGASVIPDLPNWAWHEYGMRVGFWRLKAALDRHGIAPTLAINGAVPAAYPRVTQACRDAGWEFMVHGFHQTATHNVEDQRAMIRDAIAALREAGGHDPVGWLAPGLTETLDTPDLLAEAGIRYCADWVIDDLPDWMVTKHGPMIAMPYSLDLNDGPLWAGWGMHSNVQYERTLWTLETFESELQENCRVMVLPLHPHLVGVPHRMNWFVKILDLLLARSDTVFLNGGQIADWYARVEPAPQ